MMLELTQALEWPIFEGFFSEREKGLCLASFE